MFGFRDADNWFSLSLVAGNENGTSTQLDVIANVDGDRDNVFASSGTRSFTGAFRPTACSPVGLCTTPRPGVSSFASPDAETGEVYAESFVVDERFAADGLVGFASTTTRPGTTIIA